MNRDAWIEYHRPSLEPFIAQCLETRKVPPVLLLTGPSGIGKREVATWLAQWLLCEQTGFAKKQEDATADLFGGSPVSVAQSAGDRTSPCHTCVACKKADSGTWVDFTEIAPEETDSGAAGTLKIDQFRGLKSTAGFGAFDGAFRITLIRDAERMTPQAANSLLKLLEEPPPGWIFFLTAGDATLLLPTLVSRCQKLRLLPLTREAVLALLESSDDTPADRRRIAADLAHGSYARALALCEDEAWEARKNLLKFIDTPGAEIGRLVDWAAADARHLQLMLDLMEQMLGELLRASASPGALAASDGRKALAEHATSLTRRKGSPALARAFWERQAEAVFRARQSSTAPLNKKLLAQDVLLPWLNP